MSKMFGRKAQAAFKELGRRRNDHNRKTIFCPSCSKPFKDDSMYKLHWKEKHKHVQ